MAVGRSFDGLVVYLLRASVTIAVVAILIPSLPDVNKRSSCLFSFIVSHHFSLLFYGGLFHFRAIISINN